MKKYSIYLGRYGLRRGDVWKIGFTSLSVPRRDAIQRLQHKDMRYYRNIAYYENLMTSDKAILMESVVRCQMIKFGYIVNGDHFITKAKKVDVVADFTKAVEMALVIAELMARDF